MQTCPRDQLKRERIDNRCARAASCGARAALPATSCTGSDSWQSSNRPGSSPAGRSSRTCCSKRDRGCPGPNRRCRRRSPHRQNCMPCWLRRHRAPRSNAKRYSCRIGPRRSARSVGQWPRRESAGPGSARRRRAARSRRPATACGGGGRAKQAIARVIATATAHERTSSHRDDSRQNAETPSHGRFPPINLQYARVLNPIIDDNELLFAPDYRQWTFRRPVRRSGCR